MSSHLARTYATGEVARALGIPARRLEGWAEQRLITPQKQRGRTHHGDRRQYTWGDVITAAVLAELQRLLGPMFRPGSVAKLVAAKMSADPSGLRAFAGDALNPTVLMISPARGSLDVQVAYRAALHNVPVAAVVVNLTVLAEKVRRALDGE